MLLLGLCLQYGCSCCNASHALTLQRASRVIAEDEDLSKDCKLGLLRLTCRVCDPQVNTAGHRASTQLTVCTAHTHTDGHVQVAEHMQSRTELTDSRYCAAQHPGTFLNVHIQCVCSPIKCWLWIAVADNRLAPVWSSIYAVTPAGGCMRLVHRLVWWWWWQWWSR